MTYKFTRVWKTFEFCIIEADSFEEALKLANRKDADWEWDGQSAYVEQRGYSELDEDGDTIEYETLTADELY